MTDHDSEAPSIILLKTSDFAQYSLIVLERDKPPLSICKTQYPFNPNPAISSIRIGLTINVNAGCWGFSGPTTQSSKEGSSTKYSKFKCSTVQKITKEIVLLIAWDRKE